MMHLCQEEKQDNGELEKELVLSLDRDEKVGHANPVIWHHRDLICTTMSPWTLVVKGWESWNCKVKVINAGSIMKACIFHSALSMYMYH